MLYVGIIEEDGKECMYVSNVSLQLCAESCYDLFERESFMVPFDKFVKVGDPISQSAALSVLRNKLANGGAQVTIET